MRLIAFIITFLPLFMASASKQETFIRKYSKPAIFTGIVHGVPPSVTLAQAIIESGWGESTLTTQGFNFFGVKSHGWGGETINMATQEYGSGGYYTINSDFRKYRSAFHSFSDHAKFLRENSRYHSLFSLPKTDYQNWSHGLKAAGYATAPNYGTTLINLIETYDLKRFDKQAEALRLSIIAVCGITAAILIVNL